MSFLCFACIRLQRVGTVGRTLDHCEVRGESTPQPEDENKAWTAVAHKCLCARFAVTDPEGRTTPVGIEGELLTKGYLVMQGYWGDQEKTDECIQDGWMRTGDTGTSQ